MCMPGFVAFWTSRWGSRTLGGRSVVSGGRRRLGLAGGGIVLAWGGRPVGSREEAKKRRTRSSQTTRVIDCGVEESELRKEGGRGVVIFGCAKNHEQVARAYRGMEPWVGLFAGDGWVFGVSTGLQGYRAKYPHIHRSITPLGHWATGPLGHWAIGPLGPPEVSAEGQTEPALSHPPALANQPLNPKPHTLRTQTPFASFASSLLRVN
jgi:hypothetical protein